MKKLSTAKILALLTCVCLLLFTVLSLSLMVLHTGHLCQLEDRCELCACLERSCSVFRTGAVLLLYTLGAHILFHCLAKLAASALPAVLATPVFLHVRMNH